MDSDGERVSQGRTPADVSSATLEGSSEGNEGRPEDVMASPRAAVADGSNMQRMRQLREPGSSTSSNRNSSAGSSAPGPPSATPFHGHSRGSKPLPVDSMVFNLPPGLLPFVQGSNAALSNFSGLSRLAEDGSDVPASEYSGSLTPQESKASQVRRSSLPNPLLKRSILHPHAPLAPSPKASATPWHGRPGESTSSGPWNAPFPAEQNAYTTPYKNILVGQGKLSNTVRSDVGSGSGFIMTNSNLDGEDHPSVFPARRQTYPSEQVSANMMSQKLSIISGKNSPAGYGNQENNHPEALLAQRRAVGMYEIGSSSGSVSVSGTYGQVPVEDVLEQAVLDQNVDKVAALLEAGHDPNRVGNATKCPLLIAAIASANERMVKTLLAAGADIEIKDSKRCSALHHATARGYRNLVKVLLVAGADLYAKTERGHLPVQLATDNKVHQLLASRMQAAMEDRIHQSQLSFPASPRSPVLPRHWFDQEHASQFASHHLHSPSSDRSTNDSCSSAASSSADYIDAHARQSRGSTELSSPTSRGVFPLHFYEDNISPLHSPRSPQSRALQRQESHLSQSSMETADRLPREFVGPSQGLGGRAEMKVSSSSMSEQGSKRVGISKYPEKQISADTSSPGRESWGLDEDEDLSEQEELQSKVGRFKIADTLMIPSGRLKSVRRGSAENVLVTGKLLEEPLASLKNSNCQSPFEEDVQEGSESSNKGHDMVGAKVLPSVMTGDGKSKRKKIVTFASVVEPSEEDLASIREDWHDAARAGCVGCGKPECGGQCLPGKQPLEGSEGSSFTSSQADTLAASSPFIWTRGELLGEGAFGKVYAGLNQVTGELMAVKQLKPDQQLEGVDKAMYLAALEREIALYKKLRHKHIVGYINVEKEETSGSIYIFLEYVSGGSMQSMLERFGRFSEPLVRIYTRQLLLGLEYLHANKIVHRDIKGGNVLVDADGVVKLADFGASKAFHDPTQTGGCQSIRGSVFWMAPEVIKGDGYGRRADIWSVGCTVIEMLTASHPWPGMDNTWTAIFHIAKASSGPPIPDHVTDLGRSFLEHCFNLDPKLRPTAAELLQHPFVCLDAGSGSAS